MTRTLSLAVFAAMILSFVVSASAQSQVDSRKTLTRPSIETCPDIAQKQLREATAGVSTMSRTRARRRLARNHVTLRSDANVQAMLTCLMSRTK